MSHNRESDLQAVLAEVLRRASFDKEFRSLALKNATAALKEVGGLGMTGGVDYLFIEGTTSPKAAKTGVKILVLPEFVSGNTELSKEELDHVAGGCDVATCCLTM